MDLLLATTNPGKIALLTRLLADAPVMVRTLPTGQAAPDVAEGDDSLTANASMKAAAWARAFGVCAIATDGGLVVPALGNRWNPARTRRAAGEQATDAERASHLLQLAQHLPEAQRGAHQCEAVALAGPEGRILAAWQADSAPRTLARTYDPTGLPPGFWLPGVLLYGADQRRFQDLSAAERAEAEDHWLALGAPIQETLRIVAAAG